MKNKFHLIPSLLILFLVFSPFSTSIFSNTDYVTQPKYELLKSSNSENATATNAGFYEKIEVFGETALGISITTWIVFIFIVGFSINSLTPKNNTPETEQLGL